jgi:hypothetical protein
LKKRLMPPELQQFLSGWKEIASHLGKGVRTAQRYERLLGLPVRRPAGKPSGSVVATKAELDGWVKASPIREVFHLKNPQPDNASQTSTLKNRVTEMAQLREQMFALRNEMRRSVDLLHNSICELQDTLNPRSLQNSSLYSASERQSLERSGWITKAAPQKLFKAS